jgi:hypothetical protein
MQGATSDIMVAINISPEAEEMIAFLESKANESKQERMILKSVRKKLDIIRNKPYYGDQVKKDQIPSYYVDKYKVTNLFRVELPQFWRMLYSVGKSEIEVIALVIDICDHKLYDKRFGYKS